ncbi:MAG: hypothetical protein AAF717_18455 [Bacteroidota bacterium]
MISLGVIFFFTSIYLLFAAAKRVEYRKGAFSLYWESQPLLARGLSLLLTIIGTILLTYKIGVTNALLALLVVWPTIASLVLLFAPLFKVGKVYIVVTALLLVFFELIILPGF